MKIPVPIFERICKVITANESFKSDYERGTWINAITFKNTGSDNAVINGAIALDAGSAAKAFGSELPGIDTTNYDVKFSATTAPKIEVIITYCNGFKFIEVEDPMVIPAKRR